MTGGGDGDERQDADADRGRRRDGPRRRHELDPDKPALRLETLGLSLAEAKRLLRATQERLLPAQAADHLGRHRHCPDCGRVRASKGMRPILFWTLFATMDIPGRCLRHCACHTKGGRSFNPLAALLTQHVAPSSPPDHASAEKTAA